VEPPVRQRYLALFTLSPACRRALTFQTRVEHVTWKVEGDQFECRLTQPIDGFGSGEFVRRAGEQPTFRCAPAATCSVPVRHLAGGSRAWQPGRGDINLGCAHGPHGVLFTSSQGQASRLINGLLDGRSTVVRNYAGEGGRAMEVRCFRSVSPRPTATTSLVREQLLPMNSTRFARPRSASPAAASIGCSARARLDVMLDYMKADPTVNHIELDGHPTTAATA
jgi:hypothetical protein